MPQFKVVSEYTPSGDQPQAIEKLAEGAGAAAMRQQTLLGVTGSGKTFTMAKVIAKVQPPHAGAGPQQDAGGPALRASSARSSRTTPWSTLSPTTTTTSPRRTSPAPIPTLKRTAAINDEIERLRHCGHGGALRAAGCHRCGVGVLHLRLWATPSTTRNMVISLRQGKEYAAG